MYILLLIALVMGVCACDSEPLFEELAYNSQVEFPEIGSTVYVRSRSWGLLGQHEETRIQLQPVDNAEPCLIGKCLTIYAAEVYYEKEGIDTLTVYAGAEYFKKDTPKAVGIVKIKIIEIIGEEKLRKIAEDKNLRRSDGWELRDFR